MKPQELKQRSAHPLQSMLDRHPNHTTPWTVITCEQGCARVLQQHMEALRQAEAAGQLPPIPTAGGA